jgi:hypothetical protein
MLALLPYDIQYRILKFQEPKEIIVLYESSKDVIEEMIKYTNFIVECKVVLSDKQLKWFESRKIKVKLLEEYKIIHGNKYRYKNGKLHSNNDLQAIIFSNGDQLWYKNGKLHRDNDLPAAIYKNGDQYWYKNNDLHRDNDLPAVISSNGYQEWYYNGVKYRHI